ncbi:RHS repeat-associated core domain-containing protein [Butyricimonas sp.]|uniref:RHS repeat domain-containing protein n=1 Tax=Butyricimonas sp. TaxID=1969738 RepID=UPI0025BCBD1C|nr:RHS repeat-associated core domain-containing protein [Butyricimonas sp.]
MNYFLTDHLGSVRVIVDANGVVLERNDYYPFGAKHNRLDYSQLVANRYKYNGKEEQVTGNLKYLDYGARMYDCGLGRWFGVDPQIEKYINLSPYTYCVNNSIKYIDPNGEEIWFTYEYKNGNMVSMTMHVTMKLMNLSSNSINMNYARRVIYNQLMSSYSGIVKEGVKFILDLDLSVAESMDDVAERDHLLVLADFEKRQDRWQKDNFDDTTINGVASRFGGLVAYIDADYFSGLWDRFIGSTGERAAAHEFGHLAGLEHVRGFTFNLMKSDPGFPWYIWSKSLKSEQLESIHANWEKNMLNKGFNTQVLPFFKKKKPYRGQADRIIKPF